MQYKVPQNIDIEDKVIAGLTLRQFMFIMVAGGVGLLEFYAFVGPLQFLFIPAALLTAGVGIAFAFVKINDRPFETFIMAAIKSLFAPHERIWRKDDDPEIPSHTETPHTRKTVAKKKSIHEIKSGLERLAMVVDSGGAAGMDSTVNRQTNVEIKEVEEPEAVKDVLAKTEEAAPVMDSIISQAKEYVEKTKKETPVSTIATKKTTKEDFEYSKLSLADEKKLESTLSKIQENQRDLEEKLESAKIKKFDRG